jgi:hypothetical protein
MADDKDTPVTLVGCIQRESEYRRANGIGSGNFGMGDEYVLIDSSPGPVREITQAEANCANAGTGRAYELTGDAEDDLEAFIGHRIEISGMLKDAKTELEVDATGAVIATRPTGGVDPRNRDLRLFEVNVEAFREIPIARPRQAYVEPVAEAPAHAPEPPAEVATAGEMTQAQPQPAPMVQAQAPREHLPRTGSPLPLVGLIGLLSLAGALGAHTLQRR